MRTTRKVPRFAEFRPVSQTSSDAKKRIRRADTSPEIRLRRELWMLGLRYRKNVSYLPGRPDIVFPKARIAVFVDGDFWHGRGWSKLQHKLGYGANPEYWIAKIESNRRRDVRVRRRLSKMGWKVIRVWETDINTRPDLVIRRVLTYLHAAR